VEGCYAQRASYPGTFLVTEATFISPQAGGYASVPGIYNAAQIQAWKKVADAEHAKKSFIFLQLWALGRASNPAVFKDELREKDRLVSASNILITGQATPKPLTEEVIREFIG
jgi:NADPH2 dehydrogenase